MIVTRRHFIQLAASTALMAAGCAHVPRRREGVLVNDVQSRLNPTYVRKVVSASSLADLQSAIKFAREVGEPVSICGGRHAMGAQQFVTSGILADTKKLNRVLKFDRHTGIVEMESGIQWPQLLNFLLRSQRGVEQPWTFAQKQTGANNFCLGGALSSNIHSRGLKMKPFISNVESFTLIDATGTPRHCSRTENQDLFQLAIGGYGLFGPIYSLKLRLVPRVKLQRVVEFLEVDQLIDGFNRRIDDGFLYGDFQFAIDPDSGDFLKRGIFSCYRPVPIETPILQRPKLSTRSWLDLVYGAHVQPTRAFDEYASYYRTTSGQIYWSDLHQFSGYLDDFHDQVDRRMRATNRGSEIITEIYVPRNDLAQFMTDAREEFRRNKVRVIYGTIRLIERDDESFLAWAREPYACVIFNLHTVHTPGGIQQSAEAFRRLIDLAAERRGRYYLTYHKFASRPQVDRCYPEFAKFLALKRKFDPTETFQSDWYRHYSAS